MINLLTETQVWENRQIAKRAEEAVRRFFSRDAELILNRKMTGAMQGLYVFTAEEEAQVQLFQDCAFQAQAIARQAEQDNAALVLALAYEQAQRDLSRLTLLIEGRPESWEPTGAEVVPGALVQLPDGRVGEVLDVDEPFQEDTAATVDVRIDPDTDVLGVDAATVTPVAYLAPVEPLPLTMDGADDAGEPITIENPAYTTAVALRDQAQAVIDAATPATLELVSARAGQ